LITLPGMPAPVARIIGRRSYIISVSNKGHNPATVR
jgi:hypothetical protein